MMRVLLVGPLPATTTSLSAALRDAGAMVFRCAPDEVVASARIDVVDLVLLDPTAAHGDSWCAVVALRRAGLDVGIVLLADADPPVARIEAWLNEADDCLLGLRAPREVIAHCRAVDRRRRGHSTAWLEVRGIAIDPRTGEASFEGRPAVMERRPRQLLALLLRHAGTRLSRGQIMERLFDIDAEAPADDAVDQYLVKIRRGLAAAGAPAGLIESARHEGFLIRRTAPIGGDGR